MLLLCINAFFLSNISIAQTRNPFFYDEDLLSRAFFSKNRAELISKLPKGSAIILFSAPKKNKSNDIDFQYHQNPDFYYFTGLNEPNSAVFISAKEVEILGKKGNVFLFVQPKNKQDERWNGLRLGIEAAKKTLGVNHVFENNAFAEVDFSALQGIEKILCLNLDDFISKDDKQLRGDLASMLKHLNQKLFKTDNITLNQDTLKEITASIREIKKPEEIELLKKAITITCNALSESMKYVTPGQTEYQNEAVIEYFFHKNGAEKVGFESIIGAGENTCVLHYTSNRRLLGFDDLMVCDVGAEYHHYAADVTRTFPVSGKFSKEQLAIYNLVLKAQKQAIEQAVVGNKFWDPHQKAKQIIIQGLKDLQIIKETKEYRNYFIHGTSHYLGLDVHDAGTYTNLKSGNVITVEPGIYIPEGSNCDAKWWNIGVRIEDDVLITENGPDVLSDCVVKEVAQIEKLMRQKSIFNKIK